MGLFDEDNPFDQEAQEKALEDLSKMMEGFATQMGPMMEGLMDSMLKVVEKGDLVNRIAWASAVQAGKTRDALMENGFTREEAVAIISRQGSLLSSAMSSVQKS